MNASFLIGSIGALGICTGYAALSRQQHELGSDKSWATIMTTAFTFVIGMVLLGSVLLVHLDTTHKMVIIAALLVIVSGVLSKAIKPRSSYAPHISLMQACSVFLVGYCITAGAQVPALKLLGPLMATFIIVATSTMTVSYTHLTLPTKRIV